MPLPALQNRTFRILMMGVAILGALAAIGGSASLSYRQTRMTAVDSMAEKTGLWADAIGRLVNGARSKLQLLDQANQGAVSTQTAAALRRLVLESTIFREAWMVKDGQLVCTDVGLIEPPSPMDPALCQLGPVGEVRLLPRPSHGDRADAMIINYNSGKNYLYGLSIPTQTIGELMRYGDRKGGDAVYFMRQDGVVLDRSVNASINAAPPGKVPPPGLSETESELVYSQIVPGYNYAVVAVLPKGALWALWGQSLPLYGGLALVLALCFFVAAWVANAQSLSLESELREAARLRQVVAHYQPILNLETGKCEGLEVLMRWQHPKRGLVPPLAFIPEAERTGVITELTECMMVRAFEELVPVFKEFPHLHAAINIPVQTLTNPSFPAHVDRLIKGKFSYENISFELTESTSLTDAALGQLRVMKDLGIRLAVDDFGTGYSNLRYLSLFPFDFLKIDKAFVDGITNEAKSSGLVDQIVSIGRACGLELIAEGIEHSAQVDYLRNLGVEFGQGFFFAKPAPINELIEWLARNAEGEKCLL
ncbi:MAG: EAL domain-containing protein [Verrucomicrobia bacterium]|nr:EAL domain-containing protein [Verrucomicrobiota bacterium]